MSTVLNPADLYHTGMVVADLDAAMVALTATGGYDWTTPFSSALSVLDNEGREQSVDFRFAYTIQSPHLELVQEIPGTIWTPAPGNAAHHLGYFVDDLPGTSLQLEAAGFAREVCAIADGNAPVAFAYHQHPSGVRIEIVDRSLFGDFDEFLQQARQTATSSA